MPLTREMRAPAPHCPYVGRYANKQTTTIDRLGLLILGSGSRRPRRVPGLPRQVVVVGFETNLLWELVSSFDEASLGRLFARLAHDITPHTDSASVLQVSSAEGVAAERLPR